jgi:regulator of cell morphogenesis and NO signaling
MKIDPDKPIGEIAMELDGAIELFQERNINYAFGGRASLRSVCAQAGVSAEEIVARLGRMEVLAGVQDGHEGRPITGIIGYITRRDHPFIRSRLSWFCKKTGDLLAANAEQWTFVLLNDLIHKMRMDMEAHMKEEEEVLFPHLIEMEKARYRGRSPDRSMAPSDRGPLSSSAMAWKHEKMWDNWVLIQGLTDHYHAPIRVDPRFVELCRRLQEFQGCVQDHAHLEDNVLFRRAVQLGFLA